MPFHHRNFKLRLYHAPALLFLAVFSFGCRQAASSSEQTQPAAAATNPLATPAPAIISTKSEDLPSIVAFGDSLTAGYGLGHEDSYTALLQRKLDEKNYRYRVVNAGVSGDTTAGGARRIDWALQAGNVKVLILELGGNDGLRGLPIKDLRKNLSQIIERAQAKGVTVILAGMEAPPNMGADYTREFRRTFSDLAKQYQTPFIPFVLDGVGGHAEYNQPDGIHPNAAGEKIMTETVWKTLEPLLTK
ncbi:MAG TPA: arylesterase [Blastocatellia bacterium]|nr:arylesterase [Blastocatellia bacterium]HMV87251.1 arylesterase [Blastocatellia bacterium]HMX29485.1 arylesterase [Blastocatellia bacterium]HMY74754.1 arylesterase [Blastocatellia bacterium]HMZ21009.1 arylesterase [Blastocatellia bacterium]